MVRDDAEPCRSHAVLTLNESATDESKETAQDFAQLLLTLIFKPDQDLHPELHVQTKPSTKNWISLPLKLLLGQSLHFQGDFLHAPELPYGQAMARSLVYLSHKQTNKPDSGVLCRYDVQDLLLLRVLEQN